MRLGLRLLEHKSTFNRHRCQRRGLNMSNVKSRSSVIGLYRCPLRRGRPVVFMCFPCRCSSWLSASCCECRSCVCLRPASAVHGTSVRCAALRRVQVMANVPARRTWRRLYYTTWSANRFAAAIDAFVFDRNLYRPPSAIGRTRLRQYWSTLSCKQTSETRVNATQKFGNRIQNGDGRQLNNDQLPTPLVSAWSTIVFFFCAAVCSTSLASSAVYTCCTTASIFPFYQHPNQLAAQRLGVLLWLRHLKYLTTDIVGYGYGALVTNLNCKSRNTDATAQQNVQILIYTYANNDNFFSIKQDSFDMDSWCR